MYHVTNMANNVATRQATTIPAILLAAKGCDEVTVEVGRGVLGLSVALFELGLDMLVTVAAAPVAFAEPITVTVTGPVVEPAAELGCGTAIASHA